MTRGDAGVAGPGVRSRAREIGARASSTAGGRLDALSERRWLIGVVALTLAAVAARLLIIAHTRGGEDLRMYTYFSRLPLHGINPFAPPAHGLFPPRDSNNPPLEVAFFTALLKLHDSPTTLRVTFVLADAATLLLIGLALARPRRWRLGLLLFYAFNPFVLIGFTAFAEDRTILFLGIVIWILALERGCEWGAWATAAVLGAFKFLGTFAAPAMALYSWRRSGRRGLVFVGAFALVLLLSNLPWFPHSLDAFPRRNGRLGIDPPLFASPTLLLSRIGVYAATEARIGLVVSILAVFALYAARRIEIREAVIWSILAGYLWLPDNPFSRLLLVTLPFLLLLRLTIARWIVLWVLTTIEALGAWTATRGVPHGLHWIAGPLRTVFAHEQTVRHVLWMNLLPALVIGLYLFDRRHGRAPIGQAADGPPGAPIVVR